MKVFFVLVVSVMLAAPLQSVAFWGPFDDDGWQDGRYGNRGYGDYRGRNMADAWSDMIGDMNQDYDFDINMRFKLKNRGHGRGFSRGDYYGDAYGYGDHYGYGGYAPYYDSYAPVPYGVPPQAPLMPLY